MSTKTCIVPFCQYVQPSFLDRESRRSLFTFPLKDRKRLEKWVSQIEGLKINNVKYSTRICEAHFEKPCIIRYIHLVKGVSRVKLAPQSLPTLFVRKPVAVVEREVEESEPMMIEVIKQEAEDGDNAPEDKINVEPELIDLTDPTDLAKDVRIDKAKETKRTLLEEIFTNRRNYVEWLKNVIPRGWDVELMESKRDKVVSFTLDYSGNDVMGVPYRHEKVVALTMDDSVVFLVNQKQLIRHPQLPMEIAESKAELAKIIYTLDQAKICEGTYLDKPKFSKNCSVIAKTGKFQCDSCKRITDN